MKKAISILLFLALAVCTTTTAFAASPRYANTRTCTVDIYTAGNSIYCLVSVAAYSGSTNISGNINISRNGTSIISERVSSSGSFSKTYSLGTAGGNYSASFSGNCGSDYLTPSDSLSK